ncbi:hypothetical protein CEXT_69541 [Caerostris extrusa]|uniref:Uncharacterized protein n=1 Tax=Caerostris extrusa TaxID=172846 RepID=A0AAV4TEM7_CAEEX|nr:hypothetical protein CEXT_69541 [Caerostris extrusa]
MAVVSLNLRRPFFGRFNGKLGTCIPLFRDPRERLFYFRSMTNSNVAQNKHVPQKNITFYSDRPSLFSAERSTRKEWDFCKKQNFEF